MPEQIPVEIGLLIETRARDFERAISDSGDTRIAPYLEGLEGSARSSLTARLVKLEDSVRPESRESQRIDGFTPPRHERFRLIRKLGAGGMGVVYEAWDRERAMSVALKTVQRLSPERLILFKKEFRSLAEIVHPGLVSLYELFSDGEQWFFTMEYVENAQNLRHALRGDPEDEETLIREGTEARTGPDASPAGVQSAMPEPIDLDYDRVRSTFTRVAEAIVVLHSQNKLHRDLKPGNVLVCRDGQVKLLDFGLVADIVADPGASPGGGEAPVTKSSGARVGTIGYMSPEQTVAKPLGTGSDWYSFGVMLFEVLTGRLPFEGGGGEMIRRRLTEGAPCPSTFNPTVPADLDQLCLDLLQRRPENRPRGPDLIRRLLPDTGRAAAASAEEHHFVGRERELATLRLGLEGAARGETAIVHLHGRSGVGKSALVQRFLLDVEQRQAALVLSGRCYEQETVPYKAFDSVVDTLATELEGMPPELVEESLPPGITALARIFPVLGSVPAIAARGQIPLGHDLEGLRERAFSALRDLLSNLARHRTLVIHIDDLQWGDLDSADLLARLLLPDGRPPLLLLLTYRSEYLDRSPSLAAVSALGTEADGPLHRTVIHVDALSPADTRRLAATLLAPGGSLEQIEWIIQESEGIAFFVYELALFARHAGARDVEPGADLEQVLWDRIRGYSDEARRLLEVIAVAAQPLSLQSAQVAAAVGMLAPQILGSLRAGHLIRGSGTGLHDQVESYHDRVREIVSARLGADQVRAIHAALAETFELHDEGGPERLARHYVESGQLTKAGHNYERAADLAVGALAFERAEEFYRSSIDLADSMGERAIRQEKLIHFYTNAARFRDAYEIGRQALEPLGVSLPARFQGPPFLIDLVRTRARLGWRRIPSLIDLPTSDDTRHTLAIRLLSAVGKAAYQIRPELCIAVLVKSVYACLARGNTRDAAVGFMAFGAIFLGGILGRYRDGYEFGRLSLDLVDKYDDEIHRAEVNFVVGYFGTSWLKPSQSAEELFQRAFEAGQQSGDLFHTGCACAAGAMHRFMRGVPLLELLEETRRHIELLEPLRLRETLGCVRSVQQAVRNLRGETESTTSLTDSGFDEEAFMRDLAGFGSRHFAHYHHINRMIVATHWNEIAAGREAADASLAYLKDSKGMLHSAEHHFYRSLVLSTGHDRRAEVGRHDWRELQRTVHRFGTWARQCPENFEARAHLLRAEVARLRRAADQALVHYHDAAASAERYHQVQIAALAWRLAAGLLESRGDLARADEHRQQATEAYRRWGSEALADRWAPRSRTPGSPAA